MTAVELAIKKAGGRKALATALGISQEAVRKWTKRLPAERVLVLEQCSGVSRHDLRPDLYPPEKAA